MKRKSENYKEKGLFNDLMNSSYLIINENSHLIILLNLVNYFSIYIDFGY